jgi:hypothetical protein
MDDKKIVNDDPIAILDSHATSNVEDSIPSSRAQTRSAKRKLSNLFPILPKLMVKKSTNEIELPIIL